MKAFIIGATLFLALFSGLTAALFGWAALFIVPPILLALWVMRDYRVGVVFVAVALPFMSSRLLPHAAGFNPINYAIAASVLILCFGRVFALDRVVWPPKVLTFCLIIPLFAGLALAIPHLGEGARNFAGKEGMDNIYNTTSFIKLYLIRPLSIVILSLLIANAVHDSRKSERFIQLLAAASLLPVLAIVWLILTIGVDLGTLQSHRGFLSGLGLHANEFGKLLAFSFGPLLYLAAATRGGKRVFYLFCTFAVAIGILLTFTRAAYVAIAIILLIFLFKRRSIGTILAMITLLAGLLVVAPDAFVKRITTGVDESSVGNAQTGSLNDKLTAGRIGGYQLLLPEVLRSPVIGRGTGSTAWSSAVTRGQYDATHPHNLFLGVTMDLGVIGLALTIYLYARILDAMRRLSQRPDFSDEMKAFFVGSRVGFIGILILSFAGGQWYPHPEQAFMWIAFGIMFAYWPWVEEQRRTERMSKILKLASAAQKLGRPSALQTPRPT